MPNLRGGGRNYRWVQELRDITNVFRMRAHVERPTFAHIRSIGMTVVTATGLTVYRRPKTFDTRGPKGYFVTEITRRMTEGEELNERTPYHTSAPRPNNPQGRRYP